MRFPSARWTQISRALQRGSLNHEGHGRSQNLHAFCKWNAEFFQLTPYLLWMKEIHGKLGKHMKEECFSLHSVSTFGESADFCTRLSM